MPYVEVYVDPSDAAEELSSYELAIELIGRDDWKNELKRALDAKNCGETEIPTARDDISALLWDWYSGFPIDQQLQALCQKAHGVFKPISH